MQQGKRNLITHSRLDISETQKRTDFTLRLQDIVAHPTGQLQKAAIADRFD